jgi:hypothetical protein
MAAHRIGESITWTFRGAKKSGKVRAIVAAHEELERAKERALDENGELDFRRLRIHHENRTSGQERYLVEVPRRSRGLNLDSPDWFTPATKTVGAATNAPEPKAPAQAIEWRHWSSVDGALDSDVWWNPDVGVVIRRGAKFWASNDTRWALIGIKPNNELVQPTVGPFGMKDDAIESYLKVLGALQ